ncbi:MAG: hypothetical protein ACREVL_05025, partial [Solimonas sp.]
MRAFVLALLSLVLPVAAFAYTPDTSDLSNVAHLQLSANTVKSAIVQAKGRPLQFAVGAALTADTDSGSWDEPEAGVSRWRLRVGSSGAKSLSFQFDQLSLPAGAELYLYTADGADVQGPYTFTSNGSLVTPVSRSEEVVLEARMPSAAKSGFALHLARAFHAYRDFSTLADKSFPGVSGSSGACEVNVACSAGDNYRDQIRSTVLLTVVSGGDEYFCSGSLVNNSAQDNRALILTANHCLIRSNNVTQAIAY